MNKTNHPKIYNDNLTYQQRYTLRHPDRRRETLRRYRLKHLEKVKISNEISVLKRRKQMEEYLGDMCWSCGLEFNPIFDRPFSKHEINGLKHRFTWYFYLMNKERFMLLCGRCHSGFHMLMDIGYPIEEILKILKWEIINE